MPGSLNLKSNFRSFGFPAQHALLTMFLPTVAQTVVPGAPVQTLMGAPTTALITAQMAAPAADVLPTLSVLVRSRNAPVNDPDQVYVCPHGSRAMFWLKPAISIKDFLLDEISETEQERMRSVDFVSVPLQRAIVDNAALHALETYASAPGATTLERSADNGPAVLAALAATAISGISDKGEERALSAIKAWLAQVSEDSIYPGVYGGVAG